MDNRAEIVQHINVFDCLERYRKKRFSSMHEQSDETGKMHGEQLSSTSLCETSIN